MSVRADISYTRSSKAIVKHSDIDSGVVTGGTGHVQWGNERKWVGPWEWVNRELEKKII